MAHQWGTINLEDLNSEKSYDKQKAYSQSKLANILFTRSLAKTLEGESTQNLRKDVTKYKYYPLKQFLSFFIVLFFY